MRKGFTLVETLIAIAVLSLAVTGPMTIAQKSISSAIYARDQITAYYLAQDAIEYVRNVRDTNRLKNNNGEVVDWLDGLSECEGAGCVINTNLSSSEPDAISIANSSNEKMYFDKDDLFIYNHQNLTGFVLTNLSRRVVVDEVEDGREADITVSIWWKPNAFSAIKTFVATERIFNF